MKLKAQIDEIIFDSSDHDEQLTRLTSLAEKLAIDFLEWVREANLRSSELPEDVLFLMYKNQKKLGL